MHDFEISSHHDSSSLVSLWVQLRVCWYMFWTAAEDEETQKQGVVIVLYDVGQQSAQGSSYNRNSASRIPALATWSVPLRVTAIHVCYSGSTFGPFLALAGMMCEKQSRSRLRIHNSGEECSCLLLLSTFIILVFSYSVIVARTLRIQRFT
jgi:hypothetical protein